MASAKQSRTKCSSASGHDEKEAPGNGCQDKGCAFGEGSDVFVNGRKEQRVGRAGKLTAQTIGLEGADRNEMAK